MPQGMVDSMGQQQVIQNGQVEMAKAASIIAQIVATNSMNGTTEKQEDKPNAHT